MKPSNLLIAAAVLAGALAFPVDALAGGKRGGNARDRGRDRVVDRGPARHNVVDHGHARGHVRIVVGPRPGRRFAHRFRRGHWEVRTYRVWIPGRYRTEYVPPVYETVRGRHGRLVTVLVRPACTRKVWEPGYYETRSQRVWVPHRRVLFR
jgi:hypothetical protein